MSGFKNKEKRFNECLRILLDAIGRSNRANDALKKRVDDLEKELKSLSDFVHANDDLDRGYLP
jgi:hypothetical protein